MERSRDAARANTLEPNPTVPIVIKGVGFDAPESVIHDVDRDRYLVSNIGGDPTEKDGDGFISDVSPEGVVTELHFIRGGSNGAVLNAPKGLALMDTRLLIADIDVLRVFDVSTGSVIGSVPVPDATFLNDVSVESQATILVTDSGTDDSEAAGVYRVTLAEPLQNSTWVHLGTAGRDSLPLGRPNGVASVSDGLLVATFHGDQLRHLNAQGRTTLAAVLPRGGLDGIVVLGDDDFLVSSWEGQNVYRGGFGSGFRPVVTDLESPADIGFDHERQRILIPSLMGHRMTIVALSAAGSPISAQSETPSVATSASPAPAAVATDATTTPTPPASTAAKVPARD